MASPRKVPAAIRESINDFLKLQTSFDKDKMFSSVSGLQSDFVSEDYAKSIPLDIVDEWKAASVKSNSSQFPQPFTCGRSPG